MKFFNKNIIYTFFTTFLLMGLCLAASAQTELSLAKAIKIGLQNNFGIQIQQLEEQIAFNQLENVNKDRLPRIDLLARQINNINNNSSPTSFVQGFYNDRGLNLAADANWIIFEGFKAKLEKSRLEKIHKQSQGNSMLVVENTIQAIMLAYYNTLVKVEAVKVQDEAIERSEDRFKDAKLQLKHGKASTYDVLRFENSFLIDSSNYIIQQKELALANQALNMAMGNKYHKEYQLTDEISYKKTAYNFDKLQQKMTSLNRELINQYLNLTLRRNEIGILQAQRYPTIALNTGVTENFNSTKFPEIERINGSNFNFYLNFAVSYTLFDGGQINRSIQDNKIKEQIEALKIEDVKQELSMELKNAITNYNTQLEIIFINEKLIQNLNKNIVLEKERYQNGFSSLLDYRSLQQEFLNAQQTRLEAINELLVNETEILKLTGSLTKYKKS